MYTALRTALLGLVLAPALVAPHVLQVLDEDQMLEMVDRLTAAPPPREIIVEPAATLTRPQLEAVVDRLYTQELTKREATNKRLQEKYIG